MFDFTTITEQQEKEAVAKFKEYGQGVFMGSKFIAGGETSKWADLIDKDIFSESSIKAKMLEIARTITTNCNDPFLGDLETSFKMSDNKGKTIKFSYTEAYLFLRGVLRYRRETEEYKKKKKERAELQEFVEKNKSTEDKLKEASERLALLDQELD